MAGTDLQIIGGAGMEGNGPKVLKIINETRAFKYLCIFDAMNIYIHDEDRGWNIIGKHIRPKVGRGWPSLIIKLGCHLDLY